jgi:hypothetical protein
VTEEEIDIICHRIAIINAYQKIKKLIWGSNWMERPYFGYNFNHETQEWNKHLSIDIGSYGMISNNYARYKALKMSLESFEAMHHLHAHYKPDRHNLEGTIQIYESNDYVVDLSESYLKHKSFSKRFKFTPHASNNTILHIPEIR